MLIYIFYFDFDPNHDVLPSATFELWVYAQSIPNDRGWIMGTENGGCDRYLLLHDNRKGGTTSSCLVNSGLGNTPT